MVSGRVVRQHAGMVKRLASVTIWFLSVGWAFNYVSAITGMSPILGIAVAAAVSAFVGLDPLHLIWPVASTASEPVAETASPGRVAHSPG
jgi:hypothetical protein